MNDTDNKLNEFYDNITQFAFIIKSFKYTYFEQNNTWSKWSAFVYFFHIHLLNFQIYLQ